MKKLIFCLTSIFLLFISCVNNYNSPKILLNNKSDLLIDSIVIGAAEHNPSIFLNVEANKKVYGEIVFDEKIVNDGSYFIRVFNQGNILRSKNFGYYTNGAPLDDYFEITIYKDTILVSYK